MPLFYHQTRTAKHTRACRTGQTTGPIWKAHTLVVSWIRCLRQESRSGIICVKPIEPAAMGQAHARRHARTTTYLLRSADQSPTRLVVCTVTVHKIQNKTWFRLLIHFRASGSEDFANFHLTKWPNWSCSLLSFCWEFLATQVCEYNVIDSSFLLTRHGSASFSTNHTLTCLNFLYLLVFIRLFIPSFGDPLLSLWRLCDRILTDNYSSTVYQLQSESGCIDLLKLFILFWF